MSSLLIALNTPPLVTRFKLLTVGVESKVVRPVPPLDTGRVPAVYLVNWIRKRYDLTPTGIISSLGLRDVNYERTATLGHFWHQYMPWEE